MVKKIIFTLGLFVFCANITAQDTTITFAKEEFAKFKYVRQALLGLPKECKINSYEMTVKFEDGLARTVKYNSKSPDSNVMVFFEHAKKGGVLKIDKLKTTCESDRYNKSFKIVVN
jgi:hypothetical protein